MKKKIIIAAISLVMLVGCNDVPEDVRSRTEEQNSRAAAAAADSKAMAENKDFDPYAKVPLEEAKKELENFSFKHHDNLTFKCDPRPIAANEIYNITMTAGFNDTAAEEDKKRLKEVIQNISGITVEDEHLLISGNEISADDDIGVPKGFMYHGSTSFMLCDYSTVPRFAVNYAYYDLTDYPKEKKEMVDGSRMSVDDAIKQAGEYIKKLRDNKMFDDSEKQKLFRIFVGTFEGKNVIRLRYQQTRYGLPIDEGGYTGYWETRSPVFTITFIGSNKIQEISNDFSSIEQSKESVSGIIPLSSAEFLAADGLAKKMSFDVSEAELRYVCILKDRKAEEDPLLFKPMWVFTIFEWDSQMNGQDLMRMQLYVDAVNGEVYYSDPSHGQFLSSKALKYME